MTATQVTKHLDAILKFMEPYWPWVNCHMVNFITDKHWQTFVPLSIQRELVAAKDIDNCIETVFWSEAITEGEMYPECRNFLAESQKHCVQHFHDILTTKETFESRVLGMMEDGKPEQISIKEFLSEKKRHEVSWEAISIKLQV